MRSLIEHQTSFVASTMGGPTGPSDDELRQAHQHLDIDTKSFEVMIALLRQTLLENAILEDHATEIVADLDSRRHYIVTR